MGKFFFFRWHLAKATTSFITSSLECEIIIRDLRKGGGRWMVYVFVRGGEGRARLLGLGHDFFSKPNTVADISLFFNIRHSIMCKNVSFPKSV